MEFSASFELFIERQTPVSNASLFAEMLTIHSSMFSSRKANSTTKYFFICK